MCGTLPPHCRDVNLSTVPSTTSLQALLVKHGAAQSSYSNLTDHDDLVTRTRVPMIYQHSPPISLPTSNNKNQVHIYYLMPPTNCPVDDTKARSRLHIISLSRLVSGEPLYQPRHIARTLISLCLPSYLHDCSFFHSFVFSTPKFVASRVSRVSLHLVMTVTRRNHTVYNSRPTSWNFEFSARKIVAVYRDSSMIHQEVVTYVRFTRERPMPILAAD